MDLGLAPHPLGFGATSAWVWRHVRLGLAPTSVWDRRDWAQAHSRRQRNGVSPVAFRKEVVKWLWSAKPQLNAISASGSFRLLKRSFARSTRLRRIKLCGVWPVDFR